MADNSKIPITRRGKDMLEAELKKLLSVDRPAVIKAIEEARDHGDLSENAEYDAAKEQQALLEGRINDIQGKLAGADVIETGSLSGDRVIFGAHVEILDLESDETSKYQIVGIDEADVKSGYISVLSPLSRALIGKKEGDVVVVNSPSGEREYEIIKVEFKA